MTDTPTFLKLIDFLTEENPSITELWVPGESKKNTESKSSKKGGTDYWRPRMMKPWEDFNLESLQSIYEGDLYHAVHNNRLDMTLPKILESDKKIHASELCTAAILTKWTSTIVQATLNELHPKFNACTWSPKPGLNKNRLPKSNPKKNMSPHAPPITPPRQTGALSLAIPSPPEEKKARKFDLRADAGTTLSCKENGDDCISSFIERMPKEYKPSLKFQSSTLAEFINDEGRWLEDEVPNSLMPICQTFSTCILKGCRYGCILTTSEAFIFRIGIPKGPHDTQVPNNITITMIEGGIMEYVSIPWNKASGNGLTYNLALWFLHVLAGNSNELASYPYDPLLKEELLNHKCNYTPNTPNSMDQPQRPRVTRECELSPCEIQAKRMVSTTVSVPQAGLAAMADRQRSIQRRKRRAPESDEEAEVGPKGQAKRQRMK